MTKISQKNGINNTGLKVVPKPSKPDGGHLGTAIYEEFIKRDLVLLDQLKKDLIRRKLNFQDLKFKDPDKALNQDLSHKIRQLESDILTIHNCVDNWVLLVQRYREDLSYYIQLAEYYKNRVELTVFFNRKFNQDAR